MASSKCLKFGVKSPATLHLCLVVCVPTIFDAATSICIGINMVTKVTREGLIDLLVAVAALTSMGVWRAGVVT